MQVSRSTPLFASSNRTPSPMFKTDEGLDAAKKPNVINLESFLYSEYQGAQTKKDIEAAYAQHGGDQLVLGTAKTTAESKKSKP